MCSKLSLLKIRFKTTRLTQYSPDNLCDWRGSVNVCSFLGFGFVLGKTPNRCFEILKSFSTIGEWSLYKKFGFTELCPNMGNYMARARPRTYATDFEGKCMLGCKKIKFMFLGLRSNNEAWCLEYYFFKEISI
jgi:hypothetical protein